MSPRHPRVLDVDAVAASSLRHGERSVSGFFRTNDEVPYCDGES